MVKLTAVKARPAYKIALEYDDCVKGEADLSHLVGKGVFTAWSDPGVFEAVTVGEHGEIRWTAALEICADAMYLEITGKIAEDLFPNLKAPADARAQPLLRHRYQDVLQRPQSSPLSCRNRSCTIVAKRQVNWTYPRSSSHEAMAAKVLGQDDPSPRSLHDCVGSRDWLCVNFPETTATSNSDWERL
jgi:hypothetical protein